MPRHVLFIDDDRNLLDGIARSLRRETFAITCCDNLDEARAKLRDGGIDVVVCDEHLPGASGSDFLAEIRRSHPATMRVMLTGAATVGSAALAVNGGEVFRFLLKPCGHAELIETVRAALEEKQLMDRCRAALRLLQRQNALLRAIERRRPGLAARLLAERGAGSVAADELDDDALAERVEVEIVRARSAVGE